MRFVNGSLRLSPSDLSNYLVCHHLTSLDLAVAAGGLRPPAMQSQFLDALRARGIEHERAFVESLRHRGLVVVDVPGEGLSQERFVATRAAMTSGAGVIIQAPLGRQGWAGYADVLVRVESSSDLGPWSYEALDTKLARETRGATILQLCVYSDMLVELQGVRPEHFHVVTPGDPFVQQTYRFDDFAAYYRMVRTGLNAAVAHGATNGTYPDPTPHCDICRWSGPCSAR